MLYLVVILSKFVYKKFTAHNNSDSGLAIQMRLVEREPLDACYWIKYQYISISYFYLKQHCHALGLIV